MTENEKKLLDIFLAEYNSLRAEIIARTQTQNQVLNFLLIIIGATISAVVVSANSNINMRLVLLIVALFLPLITFPLAFIFFDAEIMIHAVGSHLHENLRKNISNIVEVDKPQDERLVFASTWDFEHLDTTTKARQHLLSIGRWWIFLVPTFIPVLALVIYSIENWGWWSTQLIPLSTVHSTTLIISGFVVFLIDILMSFLLVLGINWTLNRCKALGRPTFSSQLWKSLFRNKSGTSTPAA